MKAKRPTPMATARKTIADAHTSTAARPGLALRKNTEAIIVLSVTLATLREDVMFHNGEVIPYHVLNSHDTVQVQIVYRQYWKIRPAPLSTTASDPAYQAVMLRYAQKMVSWRMRYMDRTLTGYAATPDGLLKRA